MTLISYCYLERGSMAKQCDSVIVLGQQGMLAVQFKVWLAMKDKEKTVFGITDLQDELPRVKADLSDPEPVMQAVQVSIARASSVYLLHRPTGLNGAFES